MCHHISDAVVHNKRATPSTDAVQIINSLKNFMDAMHRAGISHRAVNPQNIIYCPNSSWLWALQNWEYAANIGEAATVPPVTHYTDPQTATCRLHGHKVEIASTASDVWSLGVVAYSMLCQTTPFPPNSTPAQVLPLTNVQI